ncbi:MAG TPA: hypothetical protein VHC92_13065 [Rhodanobacteraceae bacterium]|nr:hypothetical protein [Rhodanobacteraceae bacterium]
MNFPWSQPEPARTPAPASKLQPKPRAEDIAARVEKYRDRLKRGGILLVVEPDGRFRTDPVRDVLAAVMTAPVGSVVTVRADKVTDEVRAVAERRGVELVEVSAA